MKTVAIEGINGAGKTPSIECAVHNLESMGMHVYQAAPYHLVRQHIEEPDVYPLLLSRPERAINLLQHVMDVVEQAAIDADADVLVYDRHWATAFVNTEQAPSIPELWGNRIVPTIMLTSPLEHVLRLARRGYQAQWLQTDTLKYYLEQYDQVYETHKEYFLGRFVVVNAEQDLSEIANAITACIIGMD